MTQKETPPASGADVIVKGATAAAEAGIGASTDDGVETAKAVVAAPSESVKGEIGAVVTDLSAADSKGTEQSGASDSAEPGAPAEADAEVEPEPAAAPVPEPAPENVASPAPATSGIVAPPEASHAAEAGEPATAGATAAAGHSAEDVAEPDGGEHHAPAANGTSSAAPPDDVSAVTHPGTVQELTKRLSGAALQTPPQPVTPIKPVSPEKQQASVPVAAAAVLGARAPSRSPSVNQRSGEASPPSTHDTKNTINVSQLLKLGAFKMQPLKDFVPYAELLRLRVEDGIDATRREDYLNDADFKEVFGMDRETFKKQPAWRQAQAKKKTSLY